jgi:hypothetical protein
MGRNHPTALSPVRVRTFPHSLNWGEEWKGRNFPGALTPRPGMVTCNTLVTQQQAGRLKTFLGDDITKYAPVAQLIRAGMSNIQGRRFESCRVL